METIERVARAICRANGGIPDDIRIYGTGPVWTVYIKDAQAAIDAMEVYQISDQNTYSGMVTGIANLECGLVVNCEQEIRETMK